MFTILLHIVFKMITVYIVLLHSPNDIVENPSVFVTRNDASGSQTIKQHNYVNLCVSIRSVACCACHHGNGTVCVGCALTTVRYNCISKLCIITRLTAGGVLV